MARVSGKEVTTGKLAKRAESTQLLAGVKVVEFSWVATGPLTGKYLADCGAEVIKIEGRTRPDGHRTARPTFPLVRDIKGDISKLNYGKFNLYNTSKMSLCLNLTRPKAKEIAKKLIAQADVVLDNMSAGALDRMGLGYEELKKVKPDIIQLGSSLQGRDGPAAKARGGGKDLVALSGFTNIAGWPDRKPAELGFYTDYIGPHYNAVAIAAALVYRWRTGKGMFIDMSQCEAGLQFMAPTLLDYAVNGRIANRMGNRSTYAVPHAAYHCRGDDRWCAIAVATDEEWQSFVKVIGQPAWTQDTRFSTFLERKKNEEELDKLVEAWTVNRSAEEVMAMMQAAGVPAGVVTTGEDLVDRDPQLSQERYFRVLDHPEGGSYLVHTSPFVPSKSYDEVRRASLLGEHNEYVLKERLGLSDEEIAELKSDGAVE